MKTGIFYGSTLGMTEAVADKIAAELAVPAGDIHNVSDTDVSKVRDYDRLIFGSSTWGSGELQDDWIDFLDRLSQENLAGKTVALFGCGDSAGYEDTFCDAMGIIYDALAKTGCAFTGFCDASEYTFASSAACRDGKFVGLPLDENNESERTDTRIAAWVESLNKV